LHGPILVNGASGFVGANLFRTVAAVRDDDIVLIEGHPRILTRCVFEKRGEPGAENPRLRRITGV